MKVIYSFCLLGACLIPQEATVCAAAEQDQPSSPKAKFENSFDVLDDKFKTDVQPLLREFCLDCHSAEVSEGDLNLARFVTLATVRSDHAPWKKVEQMVSRGEMPPERADRPSAEQQKKLLQWVRDYLKTEARAGAGDPGPVVLKRLNNAEYTYSIRDLTGIELNPAREFPTDSASGEGFTNTGNSLVMSPTLLTKFLDAGKEIANHAVLLPDGFKFSIHTTERDWTDECVAKIREFYGQFGEAIQLGTGATVGNVNVHGNTSFGQVGRLPLVRYITATLARRAVLVAGSTTIQEVAQEFGLNAKYLQTLWSTLQDTSPSPLLDDLRVRWRAAKPEDAVTLVERITAWQRALWTFHPVGLIGRQGGPTRWLEAATPIVTRQELLCPLPAAAEPAAENDVVVSLVVTDAGDGDAGDFVVVERPRLVGKEKPEILLCDVREYCRKLPELQRRDSAEPVWGLDPALFGKDSSSGALDAESLCVRAPVAIEIRLPAGVAAGRKLVATAVIDSKSANAGSVQVEIVQGPASATAGLLPSEVSVTYSQVKQVYSDRRDLSFKRPILVGENSATRQRFEAAMDEHRRVFPAALCYAQIVPVDEVLTFTLFYREDNHLVRLMLDQSQQTRLDQMWEELRYISQSDLQHLTVLESLLETYLGNGLTDRSQYDAVKPLHKPFQERAAAFRRTLADSEPKHLAGLVEFASRAYRRPLTNDEAQQLLELYRQLRDDGLSHDKAFRLTLARIFVAAPFLYRLEKVAGGPASVAVSNWELAGRLSYFLWSSVPDDELRAAAVKETLQHRDILSAQANRMLKNDRVRRLAIEFACQWLHIYDFDNAEVKSTEHYPEFAELRDEMYEEAISFITNLIQRDGSILELLDADHTFVNERLAKFYGLDGIDGEKWRRVNGIKKHGRGGILGLAVTLAKQSGAARTSPILRGNWIAEVLLGERLPRPPKDIPQLAETVPRGLTERQLIERHTRDSACAKCHSRIDPFGFALEAFDAIGRQRDVAKDSPVDVHSVLPDGTRIEGLAGLRTYLLEKRRDDFVAQFCRKLLGYALGRETRLHDEPLLAEMQQCLKRNDYRVSTAIDMIINSRQFREIRGREFESQNHHERKS